MPLEKKIVGTHDLQIAIWNIAEDETYFLSKLEIHTPEKEIIASLNKRKKLEWLGSRYLLHLMSGRTIRAEFVKDLHGKPHLLDSTYHVSISHSRKMVAVVASPKIVGIDVQYFVSKISRIQHKYVSDEERKMITKNRELEYLHIIWGAKESLYKAYGKRKLDFRDHIFISSFDASRAEGNFIGEVKKDDYYQKFELSYIIFNEYVLVYAKEND